MTARGLTRTLARQLAHPSGVGGLLLGKAMDLANRRPTRRAVELLDPRAGETVCDAGCGTGRALGQVLARADCRVTGIDPSERMLSDARRHLGGRAELLRGTVEQHGPGARRFDAMLALNVLYFARDDGAMLRALHAMLAPGGRLVAYVTARETMAGWGFTRAGYHRLYDPEELLAALVGGGFQPDRIAIHREPVGFGAVGLFAIAQG
ncbi:class I SAM-dependent methyltransferase [Erythrobacter sp. NE805]|uniref:class I SAM-dependent methyltransferase n=1 Tax=Erythrobacter sp. NE805 TaxID=3389875 RepID=UPI00396B0217